MTKKEAKRDEEIKNLFHHTDLTYTEIGKVYGNKTMYKPDKIKNGYF